MEEEFQVDKRKKDKAGFCFVGSLQRKGEKPSWDSPWGKGRPGWHIRVFCYGKKYLVKRLTSIMVGLTMFLTMRTKILQSECANGCEFSKLSRLIFKFALEKMSKSLGNISTIQ